MEEVNNIGKGFGITGFIFGLLSILVFIIWWIPALIFGVLGLIFCIIQLKKRRTGLAIAGLILSIIGILLALSVILVWNIVAKTVRKGAEGIEPQF